jgi:dCMP deaminase
MLIINCGIKRVVCERKYHAAADSEELLRQAGIQLEYKHNEVLKYDTPGSTHPGLREGWD